VRVSHHGITINLSKFVTRLGEKFQNDFGFSAISKQSSAQSAKWRRNSRIEEVNMNEAEVHALIQSGMPEASVTVHGPDGVHFEAVVISKQFQGKLPLARHRLVYACLGSKMGQEIHALSLKTYTPEEAKARA
jgi:acid stress-induced BolA-like protein IbaG/YrbA